MNTSHVNITKWALHFPKLGEWVTRRGFGEVKNNDNCDLRGIINSRRPERSVGCTLFVDLYFNDTLQWFTYCWSLRKEINRWPVDSLGKGPESRNFGGSFATPSWGIYNELSCIAALQIVIIQQLPTNNCLRRTHYWDDYTQEVPPVTRSVHPVQSDAGHVT